MVKRILCVILAMLLEAVIFCPGKINAAGKITLVVFDLEGVNMEPGEASMLSDNLREALFRTGQYKLVDRAQLERVMKEHNFAQSGLSSPEELAKLGKALQAQKIITGKIGRTGTIYQVSLTLIDIETITIENIITQQCFQCTKEMLFNLVNTAVQKLLTGQGSNPNPTLPTPNPTPPNPTPLQPYPTPTPPIPTPPPVGGMTARQLYDQASNEQDINKRVTLYLQSIQIDPNYAPAHNDLGVDYTDLSRWNDAIQEFQTALKLDPNYSYAHNNLGYAYLNLQPPRLDDAINEFKTALRINVNYDTAHHNLGKAYYAQGRYSDALYEFQQTARINPKHASAQFNQGRTLKKLNRMDEAVKAYQKCLEIDPDYVDAYFNLGDLYASMGDKKAAIYYFQKYIDKEKRPSEQEWIAKARQRIQELQGGF